MRQKKSLKSSAYLGVVASSSPPVTSPDGERVTEHRKQHGDIAIGRFESNQHGEITSSRANYDRETRWVSECLKSGKITDIEAVAADRIEINLRAIYGSPSQRSCLDFTPVGYESGPGPAQAAARLEMEALDKELPPETFGVLLEVFWEGKPTGDRRPGYVRWQRILEGLRMAVKVWKIGNKKNC